MPASLNLQLNSLPVLDDTLTTTITTTLPAAEDSAASSFTDLLRRRVDTSLAEQPLSGGFLPMGGKNLPQSSRNSRLRMPVVQDGQASIRRNPGTPVPSQPLSQVQNQVRAQVQAEVQAHGLTLAQTRELTEVQDALPIQLPNPSPPTPSTAEAIVPEPALPALRSELPVLAAPTGTLTDARLRGSEATILTASATEEVVPRGTSGRTSFVASGGTALQDIRTPADDRIDIPPRVAVNDAAKLPLAISQVVLQPPDAKGQWLGLPAQSGNRIESLPGGIPTPSNRMQQRPETDVAASSKNEVWNGPQPIRQAGTMAPVRSALPADGLRLRERPGVSQTQLFVNQHAIQAAVVPTTARLTGEPSPTTFLPPASAPISTPVPEPGWGERISERVLTMTGGQIKSAEIRLTPAELGPVRIQVSVDDGAANVTFHAQHSITRDAIEQALPRLREMLAENGLALGEANVGEHDETRSNHDPHAETKSPRGSVDDIGVASEGDEAQSRRKVDTANSLVDTFA